MADLVKIMCENYLKAFKLTKGDSMKGHVEARRLHRASATQCLLGK